MLRRLSIARRIRLLFLAVFGLSSLMIAGLVLALWNDQAAATQISRDALEQAVRDKLEVSSRTLASTLGQQLASVHDPDERAAIAVRAVADQ